MTLDTAHYGSYGRLLTDALKLSDGLIKYFHLTNTSNPYSDDHLPLHGNYLELGCFLKDLRKVPELFLVLEIDFGLLKKG